MFLFFYILKHIYLPTFLFLSEIYCIALKQQEEKLN